MTANRRDYVVSCGAMMPRSQYKKDTLMKKYVVSLTYTVNEDTLQAMYPGEYEKNPEATAVMHMANWIETTADGGDYDVETVEVSQ